jgi:hypothetical protein
MKKLEHLVGRESPTTFVDDVNAAPVDWSIPPPIDNSPHIECFCISRIFDAALTTSAGRGTNQLAPWLKFISNGRLISAMKRTNVLPRF